MSKVFGEDSNGNSQAIKTDTSGNLKVNVAAGSSSGTQYTDGDTSATTGTLMLGATSGSVAQSLLVDSNGRLSVDINSGGGGGTQYAVDAAGVNTGTGTLMLGVGVSNQAEYISITPANELKVKDTTTVYGDGDPTAQTGSLIMGSDYSNSFTAEPISVDSSGHLQIDSLTNNITQINSNDISTGSGTLDDGTQRVAIATDDVNLSAIKSAVYVDDADWTATTSSHTLIGGIYQSSEGTITDGDTGPLRLTANGHVKADISGTVTVDGSSATQPISASSLPLPLGAATETTLLTIDSSISATQYADGATSATTGTLMLGATTSNIAQSLLVDSNGRLSVDINSGGGGGTQYAVDDAGANTGTGTLILGVGSSNQAEYLSVTATNELKVKDATGTSSLTSIDGKIREKNNSTSSQSGISVTSGSSVASNSFDTVNFNNVSVIIKDVDSLGTLQFVIEYSWDNSNWTGQSFSSTAMEMFGADGSTSRGYFYNSYSIPTARYVRIEGYNGGVSTFNYDVHFYGVN